MAKTSHKPNWMMRIAGILLCLTLISLNLLSGIYACYSVTITGSDSARVANFDVHYDIKQGSTDISELLTIQIAPADTQIYTFTINNSSEVAVNYTLTAQLLSANIPLQITLIGNNVSTPSGVWTGSGYFQSNGATTYTLQIHWPSQYNDEAYSLAVDAIQIVLHAEQAD